MLKPVNYYIILFTKQKKKSRKFRMMTEIINKKLNTTFSGEIKLKFLLTTQSVATFSGVNFVNIFVLEELD